MALAQKRAVERQDLRPHYQGVQSGKGHNSRAKKMQFQFWGAPWTQFGHRKLKRPYALT